jgi:hypothetical protein
MDVHPDTTSVNAPLIAYNSGSVSSEGLEHGQMGLAEIADTGYVRVSVDCEKVEVEMLLVSHFISGKMRKS